MKKEVICIKNIIFDLGGVVLKDRPISVLNDINIDEKTYNEIKKFFENWNNLNLGKETLEEKFRSCNFSKEVEKLYKERIIEYYKYRKINMEIIDIMHTLKSNNYDLYVLSDNNKELFEYYKANSLFKCIDGWVVSFEYNTIKKDGILFDVLIKKYSLNPKDCYFIDDNIVNIKEAEKHGIKGYLFNENNSIDLLYNDMRNNEIRI